MYLIGFLFFLFNFFVFARPVVAVCPVCTVAIGSCVGISRWLGVDDAISGVWVGGLILSISFWIINWTRKKGIKFAFKNPLIIVGGYLLALAPLYLKNFIGHPLNKLWGVDKLILGIIIGSLVFAVSLVIDKLLRIPKQGKALFPYQKVILPVILLLLASVYFYFATC